jgi:hypothetical protein
MLSDDFAGPPALPALSDCLQTSTTLVDLSATVRKFAVRHVYGRLWLQIFRLITANRKLPPIVVHLRGPSGPPQRDSACNTGATFDVARGADPIDVKKARLADRPPNGRRGYQKREGGKLRTLRSRRAVLNCLIYPAIGARPRSDQAERNYIQSCWMRSRIRPALRWPIMPSQSFADHGWHASRDDDFLSPHRPGHVSQQPRGAG